MSDLTRPAVLEARELTVRYGGLVALDAVDLTVGEGEIVGLIGPNGAGKTTCIDALTGFTSPGAGRISFLGEPVERLAPHRRARLGLARTFQSLELFDDLTLAENLTVAATHEPWWSALLDAVRPRHRAPAEVAWALDAVGLGGQEDARPAELANGPRHLVAIARALVGRPRLVLLDEPAAGLDTDETHVLAEHLRALPDLGIAVLLVDHDMGLVLDVCDRITVLDFGRVIADGPPAAVRDDPAVVAAYLGTGASG